MFAEAHLGIFHRIRLIYYMSTYYNASLVMITTNPLSSFVGKHGLVLFLVTCFASPLFFVGSVNAKSGPLFKENSCRLSPFNVNSSSSENVQPYLAGYMTTDYLSGNPGDDRAKAVRVTVSFKGTDKSTIQSDNILASGIAAQGPDQRNGTPFISPYIDWGYAFLMVLDGSEDQPYLQGFVYKCYEWGRLGSYPLNPFDPPVADLISSWTWSYPGILTVDSTVTLTMSWDSTQLNYRATIGRVEYSIHTYQPEQYESDYFMLGTCNRACGELPLPGTVKWFQFPGAWSYYNIGRTGWFSHVRYPSFRKEGETEWRSVSFAYSVDGPNSWMDNTMAWGAGTYEQVGAVCWRDHAYFYPTSGGNTLPPDTLLWAPPAGPIGTVYIRADGSIDPPSAPIQQNANTYTFSSDIYDRIVVEKSGIIIDGAGHTVQGDGTANGIDLSGLTSVVFKNMTIWRCDYGISVSSSDHIIVLGTTLTNNNDGIVLNDSSYNTICGNTITANDLEGIYLCYSASNTVSGNQVTANRLDGIYLYISFSNTVSGNQIGSDQFDGIYLYYSTINVITENNITNNENGISPYYSSNNRIFHNSFGNNINQVNPQACLDIWDDSYPSGGNHWSGYSGSDVFSGPFQNETGSDGIGDTPYRIDSSNRDNYPIMNPWAHKVGDVNFDGKVNVKDAYAVSRAYGTSLQGPNPMGRYYNPNCDLNNDYTIDVKDLFIVGKHYGT